LHRRLGVQDPVQQLEPARGEGAGADRGAHRAPRLGAMPAVGEAAPACERRELGEARRDLGGGESMTAVRSSSR
jgi:hypothetical protein